MCYTDREREGRSVTSSNKKGYLYIIITIIMFTSYEVVLKFISGQLTSAVIMVLFVVTLLISAAVFCFKSKAEASAGEVKK